MSICKYIALSEDTINHYRKVYVVHIPNRIMVYIYMLELSWL